MARLSIHQIVAAGLCFERLEVILNGLRSE
jgi:hypothetical protein